MPKKHKTKCAKITGRIPDIIVVEPSECDRLASKKFEDLVEGCWLFSRPPPVLYEREPAVTARRAEVARYLISGDGEEPVYVRQKLSTCPNETEPKSVVPKFHERLQSSPHIISPQEHRRLIHRKSMS
ncbi:unnamed protein product [Nezara viridula]|uniref:Uncharacterized protein n=1 Tax=Nezara viridula TaxID=85310 RepID=A0A9P0HN06_NEZVI|nr:unnamed protein product [Nezara viridula]